MKIILDKILINNDAKNKSLLNMPADDALLILLNDRKRQYQKSQSNLRQI